MDLEANLIKEDTQNNLIIECLEETQAKFILKVYTLLSIQLLITWTMSLAFYMSNTLTQFVLHTPSLLFTSVIFTFIILFLSFCYGTIHPYNYIILFSFTICESYLVAYVCLFYQPTSILLAWGMTASIFIFLTLYVLITKKNFDFLQAGLYSSLWILIIGGFIQTIFLPKDQLVNTLFAVFGAIIACGYILYDTSVMLRKLTPDDFVFACLNLYLDIIMLFLRLLELFGKERNVS